MSQIKMSLCQQKERKDLARLATDKSWKYMFDYSLYHKNRTNTRGYLKNIKLK
jgi:hypothetical protein